LAYTHGSYDLLLFKVSATTLILRYKQFEYNSFYWRVGGGVRQYKVTTDLDAITGSDLVSTGVASSVGVDFAIGNHWQWENYSMGCDWIGFFQPVAGSYSYTKPNGAKDSSYTDAETDLKEMSKNGNVEFLRFYLGAAF